MNCNKHFRLFANCIPVKGSNRSVICDLQRNDVKFIPNDLFDILNLYSSCTVTEIKKKYNNKYDEIINEYFNFLVENEFIFFTDSLELFPNLELSWNHPYIITNALVDRDFHSDYSIFRVLSQLDNLNCEHIEIRFFNSTKTNEITKILDFIDKSNSSLLSVDITMPYNESLKVFELLDESKRILSFRVFDSSFNKFHEPKAPHKGYIIYTKTSIKSSSHCGLISENLFVSNIKLFTESLRFNSCLNRKISIDVKGEIRNCPSMPESYGNIKDTTLEEAINKPGFKKYWNITKDDIEVCKDCEFRYICTDCRAYTERTKFSDEGLDLSKPLKCGYNPYTNEWAEWSTNPLKQKAIEYYRMQEIIDNDKS